jgi:hypothetical protein
MIKTLFLIISSLFIVSTALAAVGTNQQLVIPVPDASGIPRDKISLTIRIPEKIEVIDDLPKARRRTKSTAWDNYDFAPFKEIPRKKFVFSFLSRCVKKGLIEDNAGKSWIHHQIADSAMIVNVLKRLYLKLVEIQEHDALRKFDITLKDLEDFQEVTELMKGTLNLVSLSQINMNSKIDEMIGFLRKTSGKGHLRIVEVKEKSDGSTVLELEILKGE